jgi:ribosomal protein S12 methylthiotransferase accessory factor
MSAPTSCQIGTTAPIGFRGREYSATKTVNGRTKSADDTRRLIQPWLTRAGITRLANVTGLDRLGVPVVLAIRPAGQTLSTNAGKGLDTASAWVSAAMEAIEVSHAESAAPDLRRLCWREIERRHPVLEAERVALKADCKLNVDWAHDWMIGWDLLAQREIAVPFGMVSLAYSRACYDFRIFQSSSNGLASGNHLLEAVLAGMLEAIERDAITCHTVLHGTNQPPVIDKVDLAGGPLGDLLSMLEEKGVGAYLLDYTGHLGIPVVKTYLVDRLQPELGIYHGHAAALSTAEACLKATLEAVQSRAVYIAGSRDDMFREVFSCRRDRRNVRALAGRLAALPAQPLIHRNLGTPTLEGDIGVLLDALKRGNIRQAAVVDLSQPGWPVHVVKVVIPGLEGYITPQYVAGSLLTERIRGAQCAA